MSLIGHKVVTLDQGTFVDRINDLIYDPNDNKVRALLVDSGGWFSEARVIAFEDIHSIGEDVVVVQSKDVIRRASAIDKDVASIAKEDTNLTKTSLVTEDGLELGSVSDIYFDSETGEVWEFEVSQGLRNIQSGKKRVGIGDVITIGKDATIVRPSIREDFEKQAQHQGLQGALTQTADTTKDVYRRAKKSVKKGVGKISSLPQDPEVQERFAGMKQGAASAWDTTRGELEEFDTKARLKAQEIKEDPRTQETVSRARSLVDRVVATIRQGVGRVQTDTREGKIQQAVGRYLTVNILSPNDKILAKRGDMVTHDLVEQAQQYGILDQVLSNVSKDPVMK